MAEFALKKKYACNYDSEYNYYDIDIQTEKKGAAYTESHTVIFPAGLSAAELETKLQEYVDVTNVGVVTPENEVTPIENFESLNIGE